MPQKITRCMLCGKPLDTASSICSACQESVRGEAIGKQQKMVIEADKEIKKHGQMPPPNKEK